VRSVHVEELGAIEITYSTLNPDNVGKTIVLRPGTAAGSVTWSCTGGDLPDNYRPSNCRGD